MCGNYVLRFDDITPGMAWSKFLPLKNWLQNQGIKCVLGVVPECLDKNLCVEPERSDFFDLIRDYHAFGDTIAQHGTHHVYDSTSSGLLKILPRSEFAGHTYQLQYNRLLHGKNILLRENVWEPYFMSPSHSFDLDTLRALKALEFIATTDGYGFHPYSMEGVKLIPQLTERFIKIPYGVQTACLHVNNMNKPQIEKIINFVEKNKEAFVDFKDITKREIVRSPEKWLARKSSEISLRMARNIRMNLRVIKR